MSGFVRFMLWIVVLLGLSGCGGKELPRYRGVQYAATSVAIPTFQADQLPVTCQVFAHLLVWLPAGENGLHIARAVEEEARTRGADRIFIGASRVAEKDQGLTFVYYGPEKAYNSRDKWCGWRFGYQDWARQGDWVPFGYTEWGNENAVFESPMVMQAAFLRCR